MLSNKRSVREPRRQSPSRYSTFRNSPRSRWPCVEGCHVSSSQTIALTDGIQLTVAWLGVQATNGGARDFVLLWQLPPMCGTLVPRNGANQGRVRASAGVQETYVSSTMPMPCAMFSPTFVYPCEHFWHWRNVHVHWRCINWTWCHRWYGWCLCDVFVHWRKLHDREWRCSMSSESARNCRAFKFETWNLNHIFESLFASRRKVIKKVLEKSDSRKWFLSPPLNLKLATWKSDSIIFCLSEKSDSKKWLKKVLFHPSVKLETWKSDSITFCFSPKSDWKNWFVPSPMNFKFKKVIPITFLFSLCVKPKKLTTFLLFLFLNPKKKVTSVTFVFQQQTVKSDLIHFFSSLCANVPTVTFALLSISFFASFVCIIFVIWSICSSHSVF